MNVQVPILLYHSVAEQVAPGFRKWSVRPALFAAHMAYLHNHQYTPMTVTQLVQAINDERASLPARPVVVTFDDGLVDFYTDALPSLTQYSVPATLYIVAGFVGGASRWLRADGEGDRPMLTWEQIAAISASGIECGAHSFAHFQLDTLSAAAAREEIVRSKGILEKHLGRPVMTFAYPHGYYSPTVRRLVQQAGFSSACAVKHAMSTLADDRFALARIIVTADTSVQDLNRLLAGQGLPLAPMSEKMQTKMWRVVRRWATLQRQHHHMGRRDL